jgi:MFS family permease
MAAGATAASEPLGETAAGGPWSPELRRLTGGLLLNVVAVAFEALAIATVMPLVADELQGQGLYGWVFSAFLLANLVGIVVAGLHADARGPAAPFVWGVVLFAAGLILGGLAPTMWALVAARALQGFGGGGLGSIAYVAVGRVYPDAARPRMLAFLSTAWVVPGLIGPALAGLVAEGPGWRWVFLGLAPLPAIAATLALPALRPIPGGSVRGAAGRRVVLAAALAAGAGLLLGGLSQPDPRRAVPLIAAGLALGLPPLARLLPAGTLSARPGLPAAIATMGLLNLGFFGVEAFIPLALVDLRGSSILFASLTLTAVTITWTSGSWLQARLAGSGLRRRLVRAGLALLTIGAVGITLLLSPAVPPALAPIVWGIGGIGMGLAFSTISLSVLETAPTGQEGEASASLQLANMLGSGLGAGIGGALIATFGPGEGLRRALTVQNAAMIGVLLLALLVAGRLPAIRAAKDGEPHHG